MERWSQKEIERSEVVSREYLGIISYFEVIYIDALWYAAERAEEAFQNLEITLRENVDPSVSFGLLQEALMHAAAISRFFWPAKSSGKLAAARGLKLRLAFEIGEHSSLKDRAFRNALEHYDEHLDRYLLDIVAGPIFSRPIIENIDRFKPEEIKHVFKLIDPRRGICVLLGERLNYTDIRMEITNLILLADKMDKCGGRLKNGNARLMEGT